MNTSSRIFMCIFLAGGLLLSCSKKSDYNEENNPASTGTYKDLDAVPDLIETLNDSSSEKAIFPTFANSIGSTILFKSNSEEHTQSGLYPD